MNRSFNKTKIIATTGPASCTPEHLLNLVNAGVDVFRLNFSHGTYEDHAKIVDNIKDINRTHKTDIGILADLQGPKIRIGELENGKIDIAPGDTINFTTEECLGNKDHIYLSYQNFPKDVTVGERILLDDGKFEMEVVKTDKKTRVTAKVIYGGELFPKKGVNLPNTKISLPSLTEKDLKDLDFAISKTANWIALSFVRSAEDILGLKKILAEKGSTAKVIAKIEKPEACKNIDEIIQVTDAIMIARGDLGVEVPMEEGPMIQKEIVRKSRKLAKPVIIATQLMDSMIKNPRPTRAETTDAANAVLDGADALMLSGETSIGANPVLVIEALEKIIANIESEDHIYYKSQSPDKNSPTFLSDAVCFNACVLAEEIGAKAIIGMTRSGYTGFMVSSMRPKAEIFVFTDNPALRYSMSMTFGVRTFFYDKMESTDATITDLKKYLKDNKFLKKGDIVVNVASMPLEDQGRTNMLKVSKID